MLRKEKLMRNLKVCGFFNNSAYELGKRDILLKNADIQCHSI